MSSSPNSSCSLSPRATCAVHAPAKQSACCSVSTVGRSELEHARALLDRVAVLVRGHDSDGGDAELVDEFGQELRRRRRR